ncbi:hypothetical protein [Agromyces humi]|uniref:hypothetical protein n=1 Tax=Agromyces humi TaxID=1766800 RepID=UPI00135A88AF|nr:hypothetical protein [Agromyces humi]
MTTTDAARDEAWAAYAREDEEFTGGNPKGRAYRAFQTAFTQGVTAGRTAQLADVRAEVQRMLNVYVDPDTGSFDEDAWRFVSELRELVGTTVDELSAS